MATITSKKASTKPAVVEEDEDEEEAPAPKRNGTAPKAAAKTAPAAAPKVTPKAKAEPKPGTTGKIKQGETELTEAEAITSLINKIKTVGKHFAADNVTQADHDTMKSCQYHLEFLRDFAHHKANPKDEKGLPAVHNVYDRYTRSLPADE